MNSSVTIGGIPLGPQHPPVFLAEIGTFFNQDVDTAHVMAGRIAEARRTCPQTPLVLKGEVLHDADVCLDDDTVENYVAKDGTRRQERYRDLVERKVVPLEQYRRLYAVAREHDMPFVLSVYDFTGADFAVEVGAVALKIASANLTHLPLIRHVAAKGLPVVIDTGRAAFEEVARAVRVAREAGCTELVVEHSPDGHPALAETHNLRLLETYARCFDVPVGLSDHYQGEEMLYVSVALGASLVEKGVTFDPAALDQDVAHAMALDDLPRVMARLHDAWQALGRPYRPAGQVIRGNVGTSQRPGLVARTALRPGDRVDLTSVRFAWPAKGIPAFQWDMVEGWEMAREVAAGTPIGWADVRPVSA